MISPLLTKLFDLILKRKISQWLKNNNKRAKRQATFENQHATTKHIATFRVIVEDCRDKKKVPSIVSMIVRKGKDQKKLVSFLISIVL